MSSLGIHKIKPQVILVGLYILTNIWLVFQYGIYGDDRVLYNQTEEGIMQQFYGNGSIYVGWMHVMMQQVSNPILLYRTIIFIIGLCNVLLFLGIVNRIPVLKEISVSASILFAVFPLGYSHMSMICFPYQIGLLFQLCAMFAFVVHWNMQKPYKFLWVVLYAVCQFLACAFLVSCGVICAVILAIAFWSVIPKKDIFVRDNIRKIGLEALILLLYFIPCLLFWWVRSRFFMPTGVYAAGNYNTFSLSHIIHYPVNLLQSMGNSAEGFLMAMQDVVTWIPLLLIFIALFAGCYYVFRSDNLYDSQNKESKSRWALALVMYIAGITAYLLVGQIQKYNTLDDRHGILLTLSLPLITICIIKACSQSSRVRRLLFSGCVVLFICTSWNAYFEVFAEGQKNDAIVSYFQSTELPEGNVYIIDETDGFKCTDCAYWSSLYCMATGKQDRCFTLNGYPILTDSAHLTDMYFQKDAKAGAPTTCLYVYRDEAKFKKRVAKNILYYFLKPEKYKRQVSETYLIDRVF